MDFEFDPHKFRKKIEARATIESDYEWRKWTTEIPAFNFPSDWNVHITPPFGGAVARFRVTKGEARVSIYLDCYDELGVVGEPYWEIYPSVDGDVGRYLMNETEEVIKGIHESLETQLIGGESNE